MDEERLVKTTIGLNVVGYIINPDFPGSNNMARKYYSSPKISFDTSFEDEITKPMSPIASSDPKDYVFDYLDHENDPLPGSRIGESMNVNSNTSRTVILGNTESEAPRGFVSDSGTIFRKGFNKRKGETVYKVILNVAT